ncbi:hypothetical protein GCM10023171_15860 [Microbacterium panaciterrae]|uniref:Mandelate racemase/muconate lactonizing enzyme N-terminal domain-containing protein n=1 Tax=Microbacterium panaciterrae TaxID=985759 RepID=A0ABP8P8N2_9MICO
MSSDLSGMRAGGSDPRIDRLEVRVYTVPADELEADGTIAWDSTTMVLVRAHSGGVIGTGWTYGRRTSISCGSHSRRASNSGMDP